MMLNIIVLIVEFFKGIIKKIKKIENLVNNFNKNVLKIGK